MAVRSITPEPRVVSRRLGRAFFARNALEVARDLLGRTLVHDHASGRVAGRIVEVEAYRGRHDPASHAYRGPTPRAQVMFGVPARSYVYLSYGVHHCLNLVAESEGEAAAVLIRDLEATHGLDQMWRRRGRVPEHALARGPGCVGIALGIDRGHSGLDLTKGPLWVSAGQARTRGLSIATGPRIGISRAAERPWRLHLAGHPSVSGPRSARGGATGRQRRGLTR